MTKWSRLRKLVRNEFWRSHHDILSRTTHDLDGGPGGDIDTPFQIFSFDEDILEAQRQGPDKDCEGILAKLMTEHRFVEPFRSFIRANVDRKQLQLKPVFRSLVKDTQSTALQHLEDSSSEPGGPIPLTAQDAVDIAAEHFDVNFPLSFRHFMHVSTAFLKQSVSVDLKEITQGLLESSTRLHAIQACRIQLFWAALSNLCTGATKMVDCGVEEGVAAGLNFVMAEANVPACRRLAEACAHL